TGCNCAQSVLIQFCEEYGLPVETAQKLASGFGGGMCHGRTCGALSGAIMVLGLAQGFSGTEASPETKQNFRILVQSLVDEFHSLHGDTDCTPLLGMDLNLPGNRDLARELNLPEERCAQYIQSSILIVKTLLNPMEK
ncbi:MAG: C-GCAxxG-C-C family protein, partial [Candidatus Cloacimonadaceae bacterium]|nr:C-GCAxxG-C-C family protein [Candidatus Cloacimonadaceae bacterium]